MVEIENMSLVPTGRIDLNSTVYSSEDPDNLPI